MKSGGRSFLSMNCTALLKDMHFLKADDIFIVIMRLKRWVVRMSEGFFFIKITGCLLQKNTSNKNNFFWNFPKILGFIFLNLCLGT